MIRIRPLPLAAAALALAATPARSQSVSADWRTDVPCTAGRNPALVVADTPVHATVRGCHEARCVTLPGGRRVCSCLADSTATMRLEEGGRTVQEWPGHHGWLGGPFRVLRGDLDGYTRPELVVAQLRTVSNGLGIAYFDVRILDGRDLARTPLRVTVEDFSPEGSFVRPRGGGPCRLLATRWDPLRDPRRGEGTYLIAQWMAYRDGRLVHDTTRPVVARRLLYSFQHHGVAGAPWAHLLDRRTEVWRGFPADLPPRAGSREGSIMRVRADTVDVAFTPHDVRVFSGFAWVELDDDGGTIRSFLVDAATGRPYPPGYQPADPGWLQLAPVTVTTYGEEFRTVHLLAAATQPSSASR